eukprot:359651-Chlamydomonas_euryale.AAC.6
MKVRELIRVRITGSRPRRGMPVQSAARQRGSSVLSSNSGLGAINKGTPVHAHLSHPYQPHPANRDVRTGLGGAIAPSLHVERGLPTPPSDGRSV